MLRIRRIYDDVVPSNRALIQQIKEILRIRFPMVPEEEIDSIGEKLRNPFKQRFRTILFAAEDARRQVQGFAMLLHEPRIGFCFLDWIATQAGQSGSGLGGALYDRIRMQAAALESRGLFFECLPDAVEQCPDPGLLKENRARLRFYERYGARPITGTAYESPVQAGDTCMPHLVFDGLDRPGSLSRSFARKVVRAVLERKYPDYCPPEYVEKVVSSFKDDPVRLRDFKYVRPEAVKSTVDGKIPEQIGLVVSDRHQIHHVHDRGYVESPVRVSVIREELEKTGLFAAVCPRPFPDRHLFSVHDTDFVAYLRRACADVPENKSLYPYVFPIRNKARPPKEPSVLAGYYCIDTFTPINKNAYPAARRAVDCALTAAREILDGRRMAYVLVRPPGHHAERRSFGGFCYLNNNAVAAHYLSSHGKVAILDIDYHHGNGQQDVFYRRSDVLTVSIHGHPRFAYPYFSGFEEEIGEGEGEGFNLNLPLPEKIDGDRYRKVLKKAIDRIKDFDPVFLVTALGMDPAKNDPTGTWSLTAKDFEKNGELIGALDLPTLVVQEGGYRTQTLGINCARFFKGLIAGSRKWAIHSREPEPKLYGLMLRDRLRTDDPGRIRRLVSATGYFSEVETAVAEELASGTLSQGEASTYRFLFAEHFGRLAGYVCYGPISCTAGSYDLYWIAVHPDFQRRGIGRILLAETEKRIQQAGGTRVYVETSQRVQYASTRAFYEGLGYRLEAVFSDFYAPGDGKVVYLKTFNG